MVLIQGFITDIINSSTKYLLVAFVAGFIFIDYYIFFCNKDCFFEPKRKRVKRLHRESNRLRRVILSYLFFVYCFMIILIALFSREAGSRVGINFQVFRLFCDSLQQRTYSFENIVMFIPLGILLPIAFLSMHRFHDIVPV